MSGMLSILGRSAVALVICIGGLISVTQAAPAKAAKVLPSGNWNWHLDGSCPEGAHQAEFSDWQDLAKAKFTGKQKKQNVRTVAGNAKGKTAYFTLPNEESKVLALDLKKGTLKMAALPKKAKASTRCISQRDLYEEKGISRKDMVMTDSRDGKKYKIEVRDNKAWMTSNLKFSIQNAKQCFLEDTVFCKKHGRFFTYNEALKSCPPGWHLPDDGEWRDYQRDWSKLNWDNLGVGGCRDWDEYCDEGSTGHYWSASSVKKGSGRSWEFRRVGKNINRTDENPRKGLYVRCVATLE